MLNSSCFEILNYLVYATVTFSSKKGPIRDFPSGPVANTLPSNSGSVGSIPGWGAKITHAVRCGPNLFFFFFFKSQSTAENLLRL